MHVVLLKETWRERTEAFLEMCIKCSGVLFLESLAAIASPDLQLNTTALYTLRDMSNDDSAFKLYSIPYNVRM